MSQVPSDLLSCSRYCCYRCVLWSPGFGPLLALLVLSSTLVSSSKFRDAREANCSWMCFCWSNNCMAFSLFLCFSSSSLALFCLSSSDSVPPRMDFSCMMSVLPSVVRLDNSWWMLLTCAVWSDLALSWTALT